MSIADICLERNRPRLLISKQNVKESYGYEIDGITYLWAEEALFLMEVVSAFSIHSYIIFIESTIRIIN